MRRAALIAGVLALLGAAGLYLFRPAAGPTANATVGEPEPAPAQPSLQAAPTRASLEARASRARDAAGRSRDGEEPTDGGAEPPIGAGTADDPVVCRLTFLGEGPRPSKVDLEVQPRDRFWSHVRRATADAWEVRLPRAPGYSVSLTLDGWESDQSFHNARPTASDRLELEVRLPNLPSIHVVDEGTGAALPDAEAHKAWGDDLSMGRAAPDVKLIGAGTRAGAVGTIVLTKTARATDWWVGAPDHAWARVRVSPDDVARRVALSPGGALRVEVEGVPSGEDSMVSAMLTEADELLPRQAVLEREADTSQYSVEGLPAGRWVVSVGPRVDLRLREAWVTAEAEVVAGRTTEVRLIVPHHEPKARRAVEFKLVVPAGWKEGPRSIRIQGCSDVTEGIERSVAVPEGASRPWRVEVEALPDGPYQVEVPHYGWSTLVRVRRGNTVIRVEIPPPATVRVRVLDAKDGKPLSGVRVSVDALDPWELADGGDPSQEDAPGSATDENARPTSWLGSGTTLGEVKEPGSYEGQVFGGVVMIGADIDGYVSMEERVSIPASTTVFEHVLRLSRGGTIDVRIVAAGKIFEAAEGHLEVAAKPQEGDDESSWSQSRGAGGGKASFDGLSPGTYIVSWRRSRFEVPSTATREVTLRAGETVKVDLEARALPK